MKRVLSLCVVICILLCACTSQTRIEVKPPASAFIFIDDQVKYEDYNGGRMYTSISKNFDIAVHPVIVDYDENNFQRIVYSFNVFNKTDITFQDFGATLWIDKDMEKYIHSGMTVFLPQKLKLIPKEQIKAESDVWGINVSNGSMLFQPNDLKALGVDRSEMFNIAGTMKLQLDWKGGYENYEFHVDVIDET